ncbi:hypothetical protein CHI02_12470 [Niallia circulans]|nr:hypothetical protein CHI02_12470 [Niallia circulans]
MGNKGDVMVMQELIESVKKRVIERTSNHYLQKHIPNPVIDEHKILLIISVLLEANIKKQEIITYAATITLIQIALDTHELVTNEKMHKGNERNRQLTVLAGDLYSGQYYKILAEIEDFKMLKILAEGIKEVNENKIFFYQQNDKTIEQVIESLKNIEGALIKKLVDFYQLDRWNSLIEEYLFLYRIRKEKELYDSTQRSIVVETFYKYENKNHLLSISDKATVLDKYLKETSSRLEEMLENLPELQTVFRENTYQLLNAFNKQQLYVEEG